MTRPDPIEATNGPRTPQGVAEAAIECALADEDPYRAIGVWCREQREAHGWTQQQLANMVSLGRPSIANLETGRQRILFHQFLMLAEVFAKDPDPRDRSIAALENEVERLRAENARLKASRKDGSSPQQSTGETA
jgi:transcriptional regulator with XRE-family HTH domain